MIRKFEAHANGPDVLWKKGAILPDKVALIPSRVTRRDGRQGGDILRPPTCPHIADTVSTKTSYHAALPQGC